jgi:hypothetical protein
VRAGSSTRLLEFLRRPLMSYLGGDSPCHEFGSLPGHILHRTGTRIRNHANTAELSFLELHNRMQRHAGTHRHR